MDVGRGLVHPVSCASRYRTSGVDCVYLLTRKTRAPRGRRHADRRAVERAAPVSGCGCALAVVFARCRSGFDIGSLRERVSSDSSRSFVLSSWRSSRLAFDATSETRKTFAC